MVTKIARAWQLMLPSRHPGEPTLVTPRRIDQVEPETGDVTGQGP